MFSKTIKLFSIFGFEVKIDISWLVILALVVWSLSAGVFPRWYPDLHWGVHLAMGFGGAFGLFLSIVFHELCHSLVARRYGLPMRGITLFLFGGVAEMSSQPPSPKAEILMAIAGPISSIVLGGIFVGVSYGARSLAVPEPVAGVLLWAGILNGMLAGFNLIPGFPLDGGRVLRGAIWKFKGDLLGATRAASRVGEGLGWALVGLGAFNLIFAGALAGIWEILIGLFIRGAARNSYRRVVIQRVLRSENVEHFVEEDVHGVPPEMPVPDFVEEYLYKYRMPLAPVVENDRLTGCVTMQGIKDLPREQWQNRTVGDVAEELNENNSISPQRDAAEAFERMNKNKLGMLVVAEGDRLRGIITTKDLSDFLSLKMELEPGSAAKAPKPPQISPPKR